MDLNELINKIGDRDLKLIELIKNNPVSKLKTASLQKNSIVSSEYYFDIDNIISLKDNNNQAVYIIQLIKVLIQKTVIYTLFLSTSLMILLMLNWTFWN